MSERPAKMKNSADANDRGEPTGAAGAGVDSTVPEQTAEINGPQGPEPTRFGDWEKNGRCIDF